MVDGNSLTRPESGGDVLRVESGRREGNGENGRRESIRKERLEMVTFWPGNSLIFWEG